MIVQKKYIFAVGIFLIVMVVCLFIFLEKEKTERENIFPEEEKRIEVVPEGPLKIGFITDSHCYANFDKTTNQWNLNWRCTSPLEAFVKKMNESYKPDFVIENGDFVDGKDKRSRETFIEANEIYNKTTAPKYHVLGNHETRGFVKSEWLGLVGYDKPYYYFDIKGYRIIVLDGNNKLGAEGAIVDTTGDNQSYPGLIDHNQMSWLRSLLEESRGYQKIVFVHQPLITEESKNQEQLFLGGKELRKLFSENKVKAVFSGHTERFCYLNEDGVDYYVLQGFWKANGGLKKEHQFKDEGIFSEILIDGEVVRVSVFHNPTANEKELDNGYMTFDLTSENSNCLDGEKLFHKEDKVEEIEEEKSIEVIE